MQAVLILNAFDGISTSANDAEMLLEIPLSMTYAIIEQLD